MDIFGVGVVEAMLIIRIAGRKIQSLGGGAIALSSYQPHTKLRIHIDQLPGIIIIQCLLGTSKSSKFVFFSAHSSVRSLKIILLLVILMVVTICFSLFVEFIFSSYSKIYHWIVYYLFLQLLLFSNISLVWWWLYWCTYIRRWGERGESWRCL